MIFENITTYLNNSFIQYLNQSSVANQMLGKGTFTEISPIFSIHLPASEFTSLQRNRPTLWCSLNYQKWPHTFSCKNYNHHQSTSSQQCITACHGPGTILSILQVLSHLILIIALCKRQLSPLAEEIEVQRGAIIKLADQKWLKQIHFCLFTIKLLYSKSIDRPFQELSQGQPCKGST